MGARATTAITILVAAVAACGTSQSPAATDSPAATAAPIATPSPSAPVSVASATPQPTASFLDPLQGTWTAPEATCDRQNAALAKAGFTAEQLRVVGWDAATCGGMMHGRNVTIRFADDNLIVFQDGIIGWGGATEGVDNATFLAGEHGAKYLTYRYAIEGDELTIDMIRDEYPTSSEAELLGDQVAQTVTYETAPFIREGAAAHLDFVSPLYPYRLSLPGGWAVVQQEGGDTDEFQTPDAGVAFSVGSGTPEPGQTVEDRIEANKADNFPGCAFDPSTDEVTAVGEDFDRAIRWRFDCGPVVGVAVNTIRNGSGYRLTLQGPPASRERMEKLMDVVLTGFTFTD